MEYVKVCACWKILRLECNTASAGTDVRSNPPTPLPPWLISGGLILWLVANGLGGWGFLAADVFSSGVDYMLSDLWAQHVAQQLAFFLNLIIVKINAKVC